MFNRKTAFLALTLFFLFLSYLHGQETVARKFSTHTLNNTPSREQRLRPFQHDDKSRQNAIRAIPWNELSPNAAQKIKSVLAGKPLFHRLPQQSVLADSELYHKFVERPDMVVGFWEVLGVTEFSLTAAKPEIYYLREEAGTTATVEVVYRTRDMCIAYAKGQYKGSMLPRPYTGEVVLVLKSRFGRDDDQQPYVVCDLDAFIQIDNAGIDLIAKLFSASLMKIADENFAVTVQFVGQVSKAASQNAAFVKKTIFRVKKISPDVQNDFAETVERVEMRSARREHLMEYDSIAAQQNAAVQQRELPKPKSILSRPLEKDFVKKTDFNLVDIFDLSPHHPLPTVSLVPASDEEFLAEAKTNIETYEDLTEPLLMEPLPLSRSDEERPAETAPAKSRVIFVKPKF